MSFDDLQYTGFTARTEVNVHCHNCDHHVRVEVDRDQNHVRCTTCGAVCAVARNPPQSTHEGEGGASEVSGLTSMFESVLGSGAFGQFPVLGGHSLLADMVRAQQGMDLDELMNSLLSNNDLKSPPTSKDFIDSLHERPLVRQDFHQLVLSVEGVAREIFPAPAAFGPSLADAHEEQKGDMVVHHEGKLVVARPIHGEASVAATGGIKGSVVLMNRGKVTFVDKASRAQEAGARCVVVCQTDDVWPYTMTDKTSKGGHLTIPCVCISRQDAQSLLDRTEQTRAPPTVRVLTRTTEMVCPVCLEGLSVGTKAVKLPCLHLFHQTCLLPWLSERNTCPLCRYELPSQTASDAAKRTTRHNHRELNQSMFT